MSNYHILIHDIPLIRAAVSILSIYTYTGFVKSLFESDVNCQSLVPTAVLRVPVVLKDSSISIIL